MPGEWLSRSTAGAVEFPASEVADGRRQSIDMTVAPVGGLAVPAEGARRSAGRIERAAKRFLDYTFSLLGLVLLAPFLVMLAVVIKLDSPGPVLFRQKRIGRGATPFTFYKFRSMTYGCDPSLHREHVTRLIKGEVGDDARNHEGTFKLECDPRVTRVGAFIRKWSIDELPQVLNVLKGEMSVVGPRPPLDYEVEVYSAEHMRRFEVLPGITGLWQVSGRTRLSFEQMIELDTKYVDEWSLSLDLRILLKTVSVVLGREGAG